MVIILYLTISITMAEHKPFIVVDEPLKDETKGLLTFDVPVTPESPASFDPSESNGVVSNLFYRLGRSRLP